MDASSTILRAQSTIFLGGLSIVLKKVGEFEKWDLGSRIKLGL